MIRWARLATVALVLLGFVALGVGVGLLLVENADAWVLIELHPWLRVLAGEPREAWLPVLLTGWLVAFLAVLALLLWSMFYVWRRRQVEALVRRLERELIELRNLPLERPVPFEDDPEPPDADARAVMLGEARGA